MKNRILLFLLTLAMVSGDLIAQTPEGFNYQGVLRDSEGKEIADANITVRATILSGPSASTKVFEEVHTLSTNALGHFNMVVGQGSSSDDFSTITWGDKAHHLKIEVDQGSGYVNMGTVQLQAVPYALRSKSAATVDNVEISMVDIKDVDSKTPSNGEVLKWDGSKWTPQADNDQVNTYTSGTGISISGLSISANANDAMWNASKLNGQTIGSFTPNTDDFLKWDGSKWVNGQITPAKTYTAGNGLSLTGTEFTADAATAMWNASQLQGKSLPTTAPAKDNIMQYDGSKWIYTTPSSGSGSSVWSKNGNEIYYDTDNVGIGLDDPATNLHVFDSITHSNNGLFINSEHYLYGGTGSGARYISLRAVTSARTGGLSNVGVLGVAGGTTLSTGESFGVWGVTEASTAYGTGVYAQNNNSGTSQAMSLWANTKGTATFNLGVYTLCNRSNTGTNYGIFALGDSASTNYAGYFAGDVTYTGTLAAASDRKFKKDVNDLNNATAIIKALSPKTYYFKRDGEAQFMNFSNSMQFGFIAQELEEVLPNLVKEQVQMKGPKTDESITYKGVDYISLIPVLTQALKEQQEVIEALQQRIEALETNNKD